MRPIDHLDRLLQLDAAPLVLVDAEIEHQPLAAQELQPRDELVLEHRAVGLILHQVPDALDLVPDRAGRGLGLLEVLLEPGGAQHDGRPGDDAEAQLGVRGSVTLALARLARRDAPQPGDLLERVGPVARVGVLAVRLQEHEALQVGRRARRGRVLLERVLLAQRAVGRVPGERVQLGLGEEVDVRIDDGDRSTFCGHIEGCDGCFLAGSWEISVRLCLSKSRQPGVA